MTELAELSRIVDSFEQKINMQEILDIEFVEKAIQRIRSIVDKLTKIEASLYLRQANHGKWSLRKLEGEYILKVLAECSGNRSQAAERLEIARNTLWRKLKEFSADEVPNS